MEATTSRRRSQRLFLQVQVVVEGKLAGQAPLNEETHTIVLNAHGALVVLSVSLEQGQIVTLRNTRTGQKGECVVKLVTGAGRASSILRWNLRIPIRTFGTSVFPRTTGPLEAQTPSETGKLPRKRRQGTAG